MDYFVHSIGIPMKVKELEYDEEILQERLSLLVISGLVQDVSYAHPKDEGQIATHLLNVSQ